MAEKLIAENRRARFDYQLLERLEAGLALTGTEVKSLRDGRTTMAQAYAEVRDGEAWLYGLEIADLRPGQSRQPRAGAAAEAPAAPAADRFAVRKGAREGVDARAHPALFQGQPCQGGARGGAGKEQRDKRRDVADRDAKRQMERALKSRG